MKNRKDFRLHELWVGDITYIPYKQGHLYFAVIMDVVSRAIIASQLSRTLHRSLTVTTLPKALKVATPKIHHSDNGSQYACGDYQEILQHKKVKTSMAAIGVPEENGYAERLMRTIKEEAIYNHEIQSFQELQGHLEWYTVQYYNHTRPHSSLDYRTPNEELLRLKNLSVEDISKNSKAQESMLN